MDSDQHATATPDQQPYILTSAIKNVGTAVYNTIKAFLQGQYKGGTITFSLKDGAIDYATSNPAIDDIKSKLDDLKLKIISGQITVPSS